MFMTIKELQELLAKVPADQQDNAVLIFDKNDGTYHPLTLPREYDPKDKLSQLNPLLLEINGPEN